MENVAFVPINLVCMLVVVKYSVLAAAAAAAVVVFPVLYLL